jgi:hypothetical protein
MTISSYQVDNILKAYTKQSKIKAWTVEENKKPEKYVDVVALSQDNKKTEAFEKISYSLLDVILKENKLR